MPEQMSKEGLATLIGRRCVYKPFDTLPMVHLGTIIEARAGKFGVSVRVEPDIKTGFSLLNRWRSLRGGEVVRVFERTEKAA